MSDMIKWKIAIVLFVAVAIGMMFYGFSDAHKREDDGE